MFVPTLILGLAAVAASAPSPQKINVQDIKPVGQLEKPTMAVGVPSKVITYDRAAALSSVAAAIMAQPLPQRKQKRTPGDCQPQPLGNGAVPFTDSPAAFLAYTSFSDAALSAPTPPGFTSTFTNLQASTNANLYLGFVTLDSYDTLTCAANCCEQTGCSAFNIYFERDPTLDPGASCPNPDSTTNIKCVFWGEPVTPENADNFGQFRTDFEVVIAGSNGYVKSSTDNIPDYTGPHSLYNEAINAPLDCNNEDTYLGFKLFNDGTPFDAGLCATACTAQSAYNIAHPPANGIPKLCRFFNTYILYKNGVAQGQYCSMYTETWDDSYAVNSGYTYNNDVYTIGSSYSFSNTADPGVCIPIVF